MNSRMVDDNTPDCVRDFDKLYDSEPLSAKSSGSKFIELTKSYGQNRKVMIIKNDIKRIDEVDSGCFVWFEISGELQKVEVENGYNLVKKLIK